MIWKHDHRITTVDNLIVSHLAGSHAYGMSTPESDVDVRGIFCGTPESIRTPWFPCREQTISKMEDAKVYELTNFMKLYLDCNPNIIETLWVSDESIIQTSPAFEVLKHYRSELLCSKVAFTFSGYAMSQMKRIKGHNKFINNPKSESPPRQCDFVSLQQNFSDEKILPREFKLENFRQGRLVPFGGNLYGYYDYNCAAARGYETFSDDFTLNTVFDDESRVNFKQPKLLVKFNKEEYLRENDDWKNYWHWKKNRNQKRSALEEQNGYDCYLDSETEFLTTQGFKRYDEITPEDRLGTVDPFCKDIEWQEYSERVKKPFSGEIYFGETQDTAFAVTGNHRMFVSNTHRSKANNFSSKYKGVLANWHYDSMENLYNGRKSHFHVLTGFHNCQGQTIGSYDISDDLLTIIGCYLSDGCLMKRPTGVLKGISVAQLEGNRLCSFIEGVTEFNVNKYQHERKGRIENTYNIYDKGLAQKILDWCGEYSKTKRMPPFIHKLDCRQAKVLLDALVAGDGTHRKYSDIYYTSSKELSDGVQFLGLMTGRVTKQWSYIGKHSCDQIYLSKKEGINVFNMSRHVDVREVTDDNIVCFTVPNENLITRRNGKIAIQGNTKHASHLIRLLRMGEEILTTGEVIVKRSDAQELLDIRAGKYTYEELLSSAEGKDELIRGELYENTCLRKKPDVKLAAKVLMEVQDLYWRE